MKRVHVLGYMSVVLGCLGAGAVASGSDPMTFFPLVVIPSFALGVLSSIRAATSEVDTTANVDRPMHVLTKLLFWLPTPARRDAASEPPGVHETSSYRTPATPSQEATTPMETPKYLLIGITIICLSVVIPILYSIHASARTPSPVPPSPPDLRGQLDQSCFANGTCLCGLSCVQRQVAPGLRTHKCEIAAPATSSSGGAP